MTNVGRGRKLNAVSGPCRNLSPNSVILGPRPEDLQTLRRYRDANGWLHDRPHATDPTHPVFPIEPNVPCPTPMLDDASSLPVSRTREPDVISLTAGLYALAAIAFVAVMDLAWGLTVENYSWTADTISDLAAGDASTAYDWAIIGFAAAMVVVAAALFRWNLSDWKGDVGPFIGAVLGLIVYFIASYDEYGDGDPRGGAMTIHYALAAALAIGFPLMALLLKPAFEEVSETWSQASLAIGVVWVLLVPVFWFLPTGSDGLIERVLGSLLLTWHALAAIYLVRHGRGRL